MKKNKLREFVQKRVAHENRNKKPREKKYRAKFELLKIANALEVSYQTLLHWYLNDYQPKGENYFKLAAYCKQKHGNFYYFEQDSLAKE